MRKEIVTGNCGEVLKLLYEKEGSIVDLIVTSPPYADRRQKNYGGNPPEKYVEWFLPLSEQFLKVLKPTGTFILNIKEQAENCERQTYVMDLVLSLKKQGWLWTEEYIWHKKNCAPGKWPNRFRDAWEHVYQFNKEKKFNMYQDEVKVPVGDWAKPRLKNLSDTDKVRDNSKVNSGFGKNVSNWVGRDTVYPTNVLHFATECGNKNHSAAFPIALPEWFIRLFTKENDLVVDPFNGSGTTTLAAHKLKRDYIGIDMVEDYVKLAKQRIDKLNKYEKGD